MAAEKKYGLTNKAIRGEKGREREKKKHLKRKGPSPYEIRKSEWGKPEKLGHSW